MAADVMPRPGLLRSQPFAAGAPPSPLLLLEDAQGCDAPSRYGDSIEARSVHSICRERRGASSVPHRSRTGTSALAAWSRLQECYDTSCIGLVAEPGSGLAGACSILQECLVEGTGPGAIVLLGFSSELVATCAGLAVASTTLRGSARPAASNGLTSKAALFEWPPMMIFLPEDDRSLGACAGACRALRSLGVPIRLEVMGPMRGTEGERAGAAGELVGEMDRFFAEHLTPVFPRLF